MRKGLKLREIRRDSSYRGELKRCGRCEEWKPLDEFYPRKGKRAGERQSSCKVCAREITRTWCRAHPEVWQAWVNKNRDKTRAAQARHAQTPRRRLAHNMRNRVRYAVLTQGMRKIEGRFTFDEWIKLLSIFNGCAYCGATENLTIDHVTPLARGGDNRISNIAPACLPCNRDKSDRTLEEFCRERELDFETIKERLLPN